MTKEGFKEIVKKKARIGETEIREGKMNNKEISELAFPGIYGIFDGDKLIYIGSAYAADRSVAIRLKQYLNGSCTGNTLAGAL